MHELLLLRHGESEANRAGVFSGRLGDPGLTPEGRRQVEAQAEALAAYGIASIHSSPKLRARQSSDIIARALEVEVTCCDALLEVDVGSLDGRGWPDPAAWETYDAVRQAWQRGDHDCPMPGGETLSQVEQRLRAFLDDLCTTRTGPALLVGHGILFMSLLWLFCDDRAETLQGNYMKGAHLTSLRPRGESFSIERFNIPPGS